jgi:excisionase family DNA binding protein
MDTIVEDRLLAPPDAAEFLGVAVQTLGVWRCYKRHGLPYVKVGTRVRYRMSDLQKWLAGRTCAPAAVGGRS